MSPRSPAPWVDRACSTLIHAPLIMMIERWLVIEQGSQVLSKVQTRHVQDAWNVAMVAMQRLR